MFPSVGPAELILILAVALIVFGPKKLPEMGKSLGKTIREFQQATRNSVGDAGETIKEIKNDLNDTRKQLEVAQVEEPQKSTQS